MSHSKLWYPLIPVIAVVVGVVKGFYFGDFTLGPETTVFSAVRASSFLIVAAMVVLYGLLVVDWLLEE